MSLPIRMKMKFSVFLYLLPFSLSVPPPTFPLFIVHPYLSQLNPISFLFNITYHGMYIWKIPDLKINEGELGQSSAGSDIHNPEGYLSNKLSIYWPKPPELIKYVSLPELDQSNVQLSSKEAYILLKVNVGNTCQLSYWVGMESTLAKKRITARFVVRLIHDLQMQIPGVHLNYISRETERRESAEFQMIFNFGNGHVIPGLYKLTGTTGDLIKALPLDYKELNGSDTFVLDEVTHIKIWSASLNERKKRIALALANYISNNDRLGITRTNQIQIGNELTGIRFRTFEQEFIHYLINRPSTYQFPVYSREAPTEQVQEERNLRLFIYYFCENYVCCEEVLERPLTLTHFQSDKTYIMIDYSVFHIFIITGLYGRAETLEDAMADAERHYHNLPKLKWKKITIIRNIDPYRTPFIINFHEFKSLLNPYIAMQN